MVGREGSACSRPLTTTLAPPAQRTTGANNRRATHIELSALQVRSITKHAKGNISISQITTTRMQKRFRRIEPFGSADVSLASGLGGLEEVRASLLTAGSHRRSKFRVAFEELEGGVAQNRAAVPLVGAVACLLARLPRARARTRRKEGSDAHARGAKTLLRQSRIGGRPRSWSRANKGRRFAWDRSPLRRRYPRSRAQRRRHRRAAIPPKRAKGAHRGSWVAAQGPRSAVSPRDPT